MMLEMRRIGVSMAADLLQKAEFIKGECSRSTKAVYRC
jgi:hypothetical protein